jgi:hypothetical protein
MTKTKAQLEAELIKLREQIDELSIENDRFWLIRTKTVFAMWMFGAMAFFLVLSSWFRLVNPFQGEEKWAFAFGVLYLFGFLVHSAMLMRQKFKLGIELSEKRAKLQAVLNDSNRRN